MNNPALKRWAKLFRPIRGWFLCAPFHCGKPIRGCDTVSEAPALPKLSPLASFRSKNQDPAEGVRWVNLRLLENPAAGMWGKEENDNLRRFAAGTVSYPGDWVSLLCWMHSAISAPPEHPPEAVGVVPLSSYPGIG